MWATAILAFIKAIPAAQKIFEQTVDLYFMQQEAVDINRYAKKKAERNALIAAIVKPGATDEEIKELRRALYALNKH